MLLKSLHKYRQINICSLRRLSLNSKDDINDEKVDELTRRENLRNKSGLRNRHFSLHHNTIPDEVSKLDRYKNLKGKRKLYGRFGSNFDFDESQCWPNRDLLRKTSEREKIVYPLSLEEMIESTEKKRIENEEKINKREEEILAKMEKLELWKDNLKANIAKKAEAAEATRLKKERLIEEVRKEIGYKIDIKDERFKELLDKKEKAERKLAKEERKKKKGSKLLEKVKEKIMTTEIKD